MDKLATMGSQSSPKQHDKLLIKVLTLLNLEQEDQPRSVASLLRLPVSTYRKKCLKTLCLQVSSSETDHFFTGTLQTSKKKTELQHRTKSQATEMCHIS